MTMRPVLVVCLPLLLWPATACDSGSTPAPTESSTTSSAGSTDASAEAQDSEEPQPDTPSRPPDPQEAQRLLGEAHSHREAGRLNETLEAYRGANEADPQDRQIAREYAELLTANILQANPEQAVAVLDAAFGDAAAPDVEILRARAAFRAHRTDAAVRAQSLLAREGLPGPIRGEAHSILGLVAEQLGDFATAVTAFQNASSAMPTNAYYRCRLGAALDETGDSEGAQEALEQALQRNPGLTEAHFLLSHLHRRAGRTEEAERASTIHYWLNRYGDSMAETEESYLDRMLCLKELAGIYPEFVEGRLKLAEFQVMKGENADAVATSRALIQDRPNLDRAYPLLVEALRREHGDDQARQELQRLLSDVPAIPVVRRQQILEIVLEGFPE